MVRPFTTFLGSPTSLLATSAAWAASSALATVPDSTTESCTWSALIWALGISRRKAFCTPAASRPTSMSKLAIWRPSASKNTTVV